MLTDLKNGNLTDHIYSDEEISQLNTEQEGDRMNDNQMQLEQ